MGVMNKTRKSIIKKPLIQSNNTSGNKASNTSQIIDQWAMKTQYSS